jgi:hypothetical protein
VEVAGIEGDEPDVRHGRAPFGPRARARGGGREQSAEGQARGGDRVSHHFEAIVTGFTGL